MSRSPVFVPPQEQFAGATTNYVDTAVAPKASLASPAFTGTPTAPTPAAADNSTKIATTAYVDSSLPIGSIIMYGGTTAPTGWHLCNGTAHGSTALQTALGGSTTTPDLRDKFVVGVGSTYSRGDTGGAASVTLTAAQSGLPAHTHAATTSPESTDHSHSGTTGSQNANHSHTGTTSSSGAHTHPSPSGYDYALTPQGGDPSASKGSGGYNYVSGRSESVSSAGTHNHTVTTGGVSANHQHAFTTGGRSASHTHAVSVSNNSAADAGSSHENRPPFYALVFIIKK